MEIIMLSTLDFTGFIKHQVLLATPPHPPPATRFWSGLLLRFQVTKKMQLTGKELNR